jgi:nitrogen fixation protein NifU and related proteins
MSDDLRDLYQEVILDHSKRPRNFHKIGEPSCSAKGHNPLCGDRFTVFLDVKDGVIRDIGFEGAGCAISTASASMMTESLKGRRVAEVKPLFEAFHALVTQEKPGPPAASLGKLQAFSGVREYPMRVKCATLAWHTLNAALENKGEAISTE